MGLIDWSSVSLISDQTYWWYLITSIKAKVLAVCESCSLRLGCMVTQKAKHSSQEWIIRLFKQFSPSFYTNKDYMENIHTYTLVPANSHEVQTWNAQRNCNKHKSNMLRTLKAWDSKWNVKVHSSKIRKRLIGYLEGLLAESNFSLKTTWQHNVGLQSCIWTNHKSSRTISCE